MEIIIVKAVLLVPMFVLGIVTGIAIRSIISHDEYGMTATEMFVMQIEILINIIKGKGPWGK